MRMVERLSALVLFWGALLGVVLMTLGTLAYAVAGGGRPGLAAAAPRARDASQSPIVLHSINATWLALRHWPLDPVAVATAGTLILLTTPVLSVAVAGAAFVWAGDGRYAVIALIVLGTLLLSLVFGIG
jgi:uncharacterized membrane protein